VEKILIVGAGPVGLTAAVELARLGKNIRIVDQNRAHTQASKAVGINSRSLELLESAGVTETLIESGIKIQKMFMHHQDKQMVINIGLIDHKYNFMLMLPQDQTEAILENQLNRYGVNVDRDTKFLHLVQHADKISAQFEHNGEIFSEDFNFVIGADGAHSVVRKSIGANFNGAEYPAKWHLLDLIMDCPFDMPAGHGFICSGGHVLVIFPIAKKRYRVIADCDDAFAFLPNSCKVHEILWESHFKVHHRLTDIYQKGKIFLAGDAAHLHTPVGGRGMNLGIEDAATIANLIVNNKWQNYHQLRYPVGKKVVSETDKAYRLLTCNNKIGVFLRDKLIFPLLSMPAIQKKQLTSIVGLS